jgi:hypothetical protein
VTRTPDTRGSLSDETALYRAAVLDGWLAREALENPRPHTNADAASKHA